jgi:transcriptional regulator with XRE-family HTH domain
LSTAFGKNFKIFLNILEKLKKRAIVFTKRRALTMTLGQRLRKIRKDAGLSQTEFAKRVGVTTPITISGWENDRVKVGNARIYVIADVFNANVDWLMTGKGAPYVVPSDVDDKTREEIEDKYIMRLFVSLPEKYQRRLLTAMQPN